MIRNGRKLASRSSTQMQKRVGRSYRRRILTGFRTLGHGVDARTARLKMYAFYRSSGADWARCLG